ncbi:sodium-dependent transporter [Streptacidiphilus sp. N1-12]|uniref:Sodium-dependent transporter n=2 Tax=Streptacidiphilus alkalitolerans TaxID=3342712 RepID=A0ABV6VDP8_9ACTN
MHALQQLTGTLQRQLLWIMIGAYLLAGLLPGPGEALRAVPLARVGGTAFPLQTGLLAVVVFNAGLTARAEQLPLLLRRPGPLALGVAINALLPTLLLALASVGAEAWHSAGEAQSMLAGLALIGAMPVAAGATVFAQGSEGSATLSLGLVLGSTLLSPLTIPLGLHLGGLLTTGSYAAELHGAARSAGSMFAVLAVVLPCLLGLLTGRLLNRLPNLLPNRLPNRSGGLLAPVLPVVRLVNLVVVVTLSYTNACGALRPVISRPDPDFLLLVVLVAALMCSLSFLCGWVIAGRLNCGRADAVALTYASGMNNSSASAVLAATRIPDHPAVLLPILAYSLLQKILAGSVGRVLPPERTAGPGP